MIFTAKFGWTEEEAIFYNTIISTAGIFGLMIGSILGGRMLKFGRRSMIIICQLICILGAAITMIVHPATLSGGRVILGIGAAIMNIIFGKIVCETLPPQLMGNFGMVANTALSSGLIIIFGLGGILPDQKDEEAKKEDEMWRVIWLGPVVVGVVEILFTVLIYRREPVGYCLMEGRDEEAIQSLARIYRKKDPDSPESLQTLIEAHYSNLKKNTTMDAVSTSFKDALCGKKYRRATWVCIALVIFDQMTGVTGLIIYANSLLVQMSEQGSEDFPLTPIQGTWLIAISTMFSSSLPLLYNHKFGRKTLFMTGYLLMSFVLFMTGLSIYKEWNMAAFSFVICMIFCFQMLAGWLNNVYFVEVCVDTATGVVQFVQAMTATITALSFDYMINSKLQV